MTTFADTDTAFDLAPLIEPDYAAEATIQQRFEVWLAANPWVLTTCERLVREWLAAGHARIGIGAVWERIRWEYGTTTGDVYRANNNYRSRMARLLIERNPEWADVIATRELRAA